MARDPAKDRRRACTQCDIRPFVVQAPERPKAATTPRWVDGPRGRTLSVPISAEYREQSELFATNEGAAQANTRPRYARRRE